VEINPLIITAEDDVIALDGKMDFDDNALYRHPMSKNTAIWMKKIPPKWRPAATV
jgi:succinyl-CoA synthetase beta subunit